MPGLSAIFRAVTASRNPAVDRALAAALPTSRGASLTAIVRAILDRGDPAGQRRLVLQFHALPPEAQRNVAADAGLLARAIREAIARRSAEGAQGAANAVEIVRRSRSAKLAYLVLEHLRHGSDNQKDAAARCLLDLATGTLDGDAASFLATTLAEAVAAYGQHRKLPVLLAAALLLPRGMRDTLRLLGDREHSAHGPWLAILRHAEQPPIRRLLPLMLGRPSLLEAATEGILHAAAHGGLGDVLGGSHFLALQPGARAFAGGKPLQPPAVPTHDASGYARLIHAWPADRATKIAALAAMTTHAEPAARLTALRGLLRLAGRGDDPAALQAIAAFRHDAEAGIARLAFTRLVRTQSSEAARLLADFVSSEHEEVRHLAAVRLGPQGFAKLWQSWPKLDPAKRLAAGRALIKLDPHFPRTLGEKLVVGDRATRMRALGMIADLGQGALFEPALARLVSSADERVAATAARALATATGPASAAALAEATSHRDARVRGNAIEGLAAGNIAEHAARLAPLMFDDASRPRANAIAALLPHDAAAAISALKRMLVDERPAHRISALWLVQTAGVLDVARYVGELAVTDADPEVQRRARQAVRRLVTLLHPQPVAGPLPQEVAV